MSINYLLATWNHTPDLSPSDTLLLMVLADQAGDEDRACFMKQSTIARKAKRSERGVRDGLATLEAEGWVEIINRPGRSSIIRLLYDHSGNRLTAPEWDALADESLSGETHVNATPANSAGGAANSAGGAANSADIYNSSYSSSTKNIRGKLPGSASPDGPPPSSRQKKPDPDAPDKYTGIRPSEVRPMPQHVRDLGRKALRKQRHAATEAERTESA